ncbi:MAG: hypothetical protein D6B25_12015 [Desulfobulbaceae bacterium]|nr:MAG: hypothetical protein D6B25_12015 [Desulfobulbaceae bacterium]
MILMRSLIFYVTVLLAIVVPPNSSLYGSEVAPETEVKVLGKQDENPIWKQLWDSARALSRESKLEEALKIYQKVLILKPNIEEVKWELCRLYIALENFPEAKRIVDQLLEFDSQNIDYLISAADIAFQSGEIERAKGLYGKAYEQEPLGDHGVDALIGLAQSLLQLGKRVQAIPLLEQLYTRSEITPELLETLAFLLQQNDSLHKSAFYFSTLIRKYRVNPEIIRTTARIHQEIGLDQQAADYWENYLKEIPEALDGRHWLIDYYFSINIRKKALPHLEYLIYHGINLQEYLLKAGNIYLFTYGRADKALGYYEQYKNNFPDGKDVSQEIANIQLILANDLISIVENTGVWTLWRDLARLTPNRIGIYRAMAELLKNLEKEKEYIEVLEIIHSHVPEDWQIADQLAGQYQLYGDLQNCANLSMKLHRSAPFDRNRSLRAISCLKGAGQDYELRKVYQIYLENIADDYEVLKATLVHLGKLGDLEGLEKIYNRYLERADRSDTSHLEIVMIMVDQLIQNGMVSRISQFKETLHTPDLTGLNPKYESLESQIDFRVHITEKNYEEAEQLLREALIKEPEKIENVIELTHFYLLTDRFDEAQIMLRRAELMFVKKDSASVQSVKREIYRLKSTLSKELGQADILVRTTRDYLVKLKDPEIIEPEDFDIFMILVTYYYQKQNLEESIELLNQYRNLFITDERFLILANILSSEQLVTQEKSESGDIEGMGYKSIIRKLEAAKIWKALGRKFEAEKLLESIQSTDDNVVSAQLLLAELYQERDENLESLHIFQALSEQYPVEDYFILMTYEQLLAVGMYREFLEKASNYIELDMKGQLPENPIALSDVRLWFGIARASWALGDWEYALQIYNKIKLDLQVSISTLLKESKKDPLFKSVDTNYFWGLFGVSPSTMEILDSMMNIRFVLQNIEQPIVTLTNDYLASFIWYKRVDQEYDARDALNNREFYKAEQLYADMIQEEVVSQTDATPELATIYGRLEEEDREFELLKELDESDSGYALLKKSIDKQARKQKPNIFFHTFKDDEAGREDTIDLINDYFGLGLNFPTTDRQYLRIKAGNSTYRAHHQSGSADGNKLSANYSILFSDLLKGEITLGFEDIEETGSRNTIYDFFLRYQPSSAAKAYLSIGQAMVYDTLDAIFNDSYYQNFDGGFQANLFTKTFAGIDFSIKNYDDGNNGTQFDVWLRYRLFGERNRFDIQWDYQKIDNTDPNDQNDESGRGLHTYWRPGGYWKHLVSLSYRQELWPTGKLQSGTGYFSLRYGIGYESLESIVQEIDMNISLEIHPSILLKGTFSSEWMDDFDTRAFSAMLTYRW